VIKGAMSQSFVTVAVSQRSWCAAMAQLAFMS
jgi:hypothetical protein